MDVAEGLKEWEGVQRIEIFLRIAHKFIDLIDHLFRERSLSNNLNEKL